MDHAARTIRPSHRLVVFLLALTTLAFAPAPVPSSTVEAEASAPVGERWLEGSADFPSSVAASGNRVVVATAGTSGSFEAPAAILDAIDVHEWDGTTWTVTPLEPLGVTTALMVAIDFDRIVAGAPTLGGAFPGPVRVHEVDAGGVWTDTPLFPPASTVPGASGFGFASVANFGTSVAVHGDRVVVGAPGMIDGSRQINGTDVVPGAALVYERGADGTWSHTATLAAPSDPTLALDFGRSVAVHGDRIVVGDPGLAVAMFGGTTDTEGSAYVFERTDDGAWSPTPLPHSTGALDFGGSVAVHGDRVVVGSPGSSAGSNDGAVHVYAPDGAGGWSSAALLESPSDGDVPGFGSAVAVSAGHIVVGSPHVEAGSPGGGGDSGGGFFAFSTFAMSTTPSEGTVQLYGPDGSGGWSVSTLTGSAAASGFGTSVAVSDQRVVVGAPGDSGSPGAVYRFDLAQPDDTSSRERLLEIRDHLATGLGAEGKPADKIGKAVDKLTKAVGEDLWADDALLDDEHGKKVFDEVGKAVKELGKALEEDEKHGGLDDREEVTGAIDDLISLMELLATDAVDAARTAIDLASAEVGTDEGLLDRAEGELVNANDELATARVELLELDHDKAVDKFKKAWERAQKARGIAAKAVDTGT